MKRFELVNIRHDEGYETLGNWVSLAAAISALDAAIQSRGISGVVDVYEDDVTFSVLEHKDGWGSPKFVHTEQWMATFSDDADDPTWSKVVSEKEVSLP